MALTFDPASGTIRDGDIRYLLMRPDVLMGTARALGATEAFVAALAESSFRNARASFEAYRYRGELDRREFEASTARFAAALGWGAWSIGSADAAGITRVEVANSPFAMGMGEADVPVCGPIVGILRALYLVAIDEEVTVTETHCVAQGHERCRFAIVRANTSEGD